MKSKRIQNGNQTDLTKSEMVAFEALFQVTKHSIIGNYDRLIFDDVYEVDGVKYRTVRASYQSKFSLGTYLDIYLRQIPNSWETWVPTAAKLVSGSQIPWQQHMVFTSDRNNIGISEMEIVDLPKSISDEEFQKHTLVRHTKDGETF